MVKENYYKKYQGPHLTLVQLWKKNETKKDITDYIQTFYGKDRNWNEKLYKYKDIFPNKTNEYNYYLEFKSDD